jgi:hypothetical protein
VLAVVVYSVHLRRSEVAVIVNCPDQTQFAGSRSLKQAAPQSIWLFRSSWVAELFERSYNSMKIYIFSMASRIWVSKRNGLASFTFSLVIA